MSENRQHVARRLHRLRYEMMDRCRNIRCEGDVPPFKHRDTIQNDPEVW